MLNVSNKQKAPTENVKQQKRETQKVLHSKIKPHENHILFEFNVKTLEISRAEFEPESKEIHWVQAVRSDFSRKRVVIRKENCLYIPALNEENFKKILKREHNITIK